MSDGSERINYQAQNLLKQQESEVEEYFLSTGMAY